MKSRWDVWYYYDIHGSDADGWWVDDKVRLGEVEMSDEDVTLDYVLDKLKPWFEPAKLKENHPGFAGMGDDNTIAVNLEDAPFVALFRKAEGDKNGKRD